jgi:hypothetical protein
VPDAVLLCNILKALLLNIFSSNALSKELCMRAERTRTALALQVLWLYDGPVTT